MSSRTAAWGQPPVSIARMREGARALWRVRNSASSRVKMSFVTAAMLYWSRRARQRARMRAVLPEPTGLYGVSLSQGDGCIIRETGNEVLGSGFCV